MTKYGCKEITDNLRVFAYKQATVIEILNQEEPLWLDEMKELRKHLDFLINQMENLEIDK